MKLSEAMTATERSRKYRKKNPGKVKSYLRKTVKDRCRRNKDRRAAAKKHGESKIKNKDVHHPNGTTGSWRLTKKDHGPDKKNETSVNEMGDKPQPIKKWYKKRNSEIAQFDAGDYVYEIWFNRWSIVDEDEVAIEFILKNQGTKDGERGKIGVENTGEAVKVFATVVDTIKKWVKKNKPSVIEFEGSGSSRNKLYAHLVKKLASGMGYKLDGNLDNARLFGTYRLLRK